MPKAFLKTLTDLIGFDDAQQVFSWNHTFMFTNKKKLIMQIPLST